MRKSIGRSQFGILVKLRSHVGNLSGTNPVCALALHTGAWPGICNRKVLSIKQMGNESSATRFKCMSGASASVCIILCYGTRKTRVPMSATGLQVIYSSWYTILFLPPSNHPALQLSTFIIYFGFFQDCLHLRGSQWVATLTFRRERMKRADEPHAPAWDHPRM